MQDPADIAAHVPPGLDDAEARLEEFLADGRGADVVLAYAKVHGDTQGALIRGHNRLKRYIQLVLDVKIAAYAEGELAEDPMDDSESAELAAEEWLDARFPDAFAEYVRIQEAIVEITRTAPIPGKVRAEARGLPYTEEAVALGLRRRRVFRSRGCARSSSVIEHRMAPRARGRERRDSRSRSGDSRGDPSSGDDAEPADARRGRLPTDDDLGPGAGA